MSVENIALQTLTFQNPRRSYTLHNAKSRRIEVMYIGNMMTLPAKDEIHALKFDTDADGDKIPGTYVVEDLYVYIPEFGEEIMIFDSAKAVAHILGLHRSSDGKVTEASSPYAAGGISLLPRHATKEVWKSVVVEGGKRAWLTRVKNAQYTIQSIDEKNARRKAAGMEAVHGGREWDEAKALLDQYNELLRQDTRAELVSSPAVDDAIDEETEIAALVRAKAIELSSRYGVSMSEAQRKQLFDELINDPKIRAYAQKEHRWRKRGHEPIKDADLQAAADLGTTVKEAGLE